MTDQIDVEEDEIEASAAPLIEHLAELRTRIMRALLAFAVGILVCFYFAEAILEFLVEPIAEILRERGEKPQLIFTAPQEKFFVLFRISAVFGFGFAFPVIAHQMWRFVAPGLYKNEKGAFLPFLIASPALFLLGASFAHYVVTPLAMRFFIGFADILPSLTEALSSTGETTEKTTTVFLGSVKESLNISLTFIFAFGICFQLPVLLTLLGMAGLTSSQGLRDMRKYAVVGILVLAAIVTPPDVVTQVILFSAVYALYEISIWLVVMVEKRRDERLAADGLLDEDEF